jgi:hypothetical protein
MIEFSQVFWLDSSIQDVILVTSEDVIKLDSEMVPYLIMTLDWI